MTDLSRDDVLVLSRSVGLELFADEIEEITVRLNFLIQALGPLLTTDLSALEGIPVLPEAEESFDGCK